jgi:hypothetical protein
MVLIEVYKMKEIVFTRILNNVVYFKDIKESHIRDSIVIMKQFDSSYGILSRTPDTKKYYWKALNNSHNYWDLVVESDPLEAIRRLSNTCTFYIFQSIQEMCDWISQDIGKSQ